MTRRRLSVGRVLVQIVRAPYQAPPQRTRARRGCGWARCCAESPRRRRRRRAAAQGLTLVPISAEFELFCPPYIPTYLTNVSRRCSS
jgi:hypothetical protein